MNTYGKTAMTHAESGMRYHSTTICGGVEREIPLDAVGFHPIAYAWSPCGSPYQRCHETAVIAAAKGENETSLRLSAAVVTLKVTLGMPALGS